MIDLTRRQVLAAGAAIGLATPAAAAAAEPVTARGTVTAPDGARAGVMVTNGRDVVLTDAAGRYDLRVVPGQSVGVVAPSGFAAPRPVPFLPDGSPQGFRFAGLPPSPLPAALDFALTPTDASDRFTAVLLTDPQPETTTELGYVRDDIVAGIGQHGAAFAIVHGDLMFDDLSLYGRFGAMMDATGLRWHAVPGNHDINVEAPDDAHSRDTWKRVFGARSGAFQHGRATFVLLDNVEYLGPDPAKPSGSLGKYRGRFGPDQLAFVRNLLAHVDPDSLVAFSFHIPLRTLAGTEPNTATVDARDFLDAIGSHRNAVSFCGHTHTNEHHDLTAVDGYAGGTHRHHVLATASGSWWSGPLDTRGIPVAVQTDGTPNGIHVLDVDGARYATRFVPAHDPDAGMRIMLDSQVHGMAAEVFATTPVGALWTGPLTAAQVPSTRLVVNVWDGGPNTTATLRVHGQSVTLARTERTDPYVEETYARNAATKKPWVRPGLSSHIWQATMPPLPPGTHRLRVMVAGEYGRSHEGAMMLEVV